MRTNENGVSYRRGGVLGVPSLSAVAGGILMAGTRDPYFDVLKFVAMYLVVLSHCWQASGHYTVEEVSYLTNYFIGFHMPIFFVISGLFCRRVVEGGTGLAARVWGYLWPAAAIELVFACAAFPFTSVEQGLAAFVPDPLETRQSCEQHFSSMGAGTPHGNQFAAFGG